MKTGILFIFLLGFGYIAPITCSKKQANDNKTPSKRNMPERNDTPKQIALFAPIHVLKTAPKA